MKLLDYIVLGVILILFIVAIIYLIKNKGCPTSTCQNCRLSNQCHKKKKEK